MQNDNIFTWKLIIRDEIFTSGTGPGWNCLKQQSPTFIKWTVVRFFKLMRNLWFRYSRYLDQETARDLIDLRVSLITQR